MLVSDVYLFRFLINGTELIHIVRRRYLSRTHTSIYLILVQISRRSYIAYAYAELILITDLCSFGTPVGVIELRPLLKYP